MKNTVPQTIAALLAAANKAAFGASLFETALPLLQNKQVNINADIDALVDAIVAHGNGKTELSTRRDTARTKLETSRSFLTLGRDNFKPALGSEYNQSWDNTGLVGSLTIPRAYDEVTPVLLAFKNFLTSNPAMEVESKDITADKADELFTQLTAAVNAISQQEVIVGQLMEVRDEKSKQLSKRLSDLIQELHMRLDGLDQRWKAFGFNMPDAFETPDSVEHVTATLIGPTAAALKWDSTARAQYYHVFKRVQGVDEDYVLVGSPADLDFTIENLPSGKQIDIVVSAVNNGGEGQRSEAVTILTA